MLPKFSKPLFFTGAGMSAESGISTYRGAGGTWHKYDYEEYACQTAFDRNPQKVLEFHKLRRQEVAGCEPHSGHFILEELEKHFPKMKIVTQNIDGMHQRSGNKNVIELHGTLWYYRCPQGCGRFEMLDSNTDDFACPKCSENLRPDIVWFGDMLKPDSIRATIDAILDCDLFVSIGTSALVYPAAELPRHALERGIFSVEVNPERTMLSHLYSEHIAEPASEALDSMFGAFKNSL